METRRNGGSIIGGSILIFLGLMVLLAQGFPGFNFWGTLWPVFIIALGAVFFVGMLAGGRSAAGLAIPGSIITVIGLMLLVQSLTGYWESWAYSWTVILIAVGLGIFLMGVYAGNQRSRRAGLAPDADWRLLPDRFRRFLRRAYLRIAADGDRAVNLPGRADSARALSGDHPLPQRRRLRATRLRLAGQRRSQ